MRKRKRNPAAAGSSSSTSPAWIDLPTDVTANILQRLSAVEILSIAKDVCGTWRTVCKDPAMWRVIDLRFPENPVRVINTNEICCRAVDFSQGQSISIHMEDLDRPEPIYVETLLYISNRLRNLTRLSLKNCFGIDGRALARAVKRLAVLEELHLDVVDNVHPRRIKIIGNSCPTLKLFTFNLHWRRPPGWDEEEYSDFSEEEEEEEEEYGDFPEEEEDRDFSEEGEEGEEGGGGEEEGKEEEKEEESEEDDDLDDDVEESRMCSKYALAIAQSMPNLRHLALRANYMRNDGIQALLDGCPRLESLDIRECYRVDLSGVLGDVCLQRIKDIKLPFADVELF